jgi:hypothetical protein
MVVTDCHGRQVWQDFCRLFGLSLNHLFDLDHILRSRVVLIALEFHRVWIECARKLNRRLV